MKNRNRLTVLEGGRDRQATVNNVYLTVTPDSLSPLPLDVRVFEEDTYLVLTVDPVMRHTEEHPVRLMTRLMETRPNKPGSVVMGKGSWYAIVHDVDADPTWCRAWIEQAYHSTLNLAEKKRVHRLGLPLLGSVHGKFPPEESLALLLEALRSGSFQHLKKIRILVPQKKRKYIIQLLHKRLS